MSTFIHKPLLAVLFAAAVLVPLSAQYQAIDHHARQAPDSLSRNLPQLVNYLVEPAKNEKEKARSLYTWLTHVIDYDDEARRQDRRINQHIGDILRRKRGLCFDYALLYVELCRQAGLSCVSVSGYARQGFEAMDIPSTPDHAWNAIFLDGQWKLVDATWGASPGQDALMAHYSTGYFLTPPRLFNLNHLPALPMWQLLPCPATAEQFSRPAEMLLPLFDRQDSCYHYPDTIQAFLQRSLPEQALWEAASTYRFHPTDGNKKAWGQSVLDYAVYLSEQADSLRATDSLEAFLRLQSEAIRLCRQARELAPPLPWQTEFYAGLLINQAVALNQKSSGANNGKEELALLKEAQQTLEKAEEVLNGLPENNYYRQYAVQQCAAYLEVIAHNIWRLE